MHLDWKSIELLGNIKSIIFQMDNWEAFRKKKGGEAARMRRKTDTLALPPRYF